MLIDSDYKLLGNFPVEILQPMINLNVDWTAPDFDRNGKDFYARTVRVPYGIRQEPFQEQTPAIKQVLDAFWPVDQVMHKLYPDHVFIKCEINYVAPHEDVGIHIDFCWWHEHSHRIHVPVVTNDDCYFVVENRPHHFEVGKYYEINNRLFHSAINHGKTGRIHLVFDIMDKSKFDLAKSQGIDIDTVTADTTMLSEYPVDQKYSYSV